MAAFDPPATGAHALDGIFLGGVQSNKSKGLVWLMLSQRPIGWIEQSFQSSHLLMLPDSQSPPPSRRSWHWISIDMPALTPAGAKPAHKLYHKHLVCLMNFLFPDGTATPTFQESVFFHPNNALKNSKPEITLSSGFNYTAYGTRLGVVPR